MSNALPAAEWAELLPPISVLVTQYGIDSEVALPCMLLLNLLLPCLHACAVMHACMHIWRLLQWSLTITGSQVCADPDGLMHFLMCKSLKCFPIGKAMVTVLACSSVDGPGYPAGHPIQVLISVDLFSALQTVDKEYYQTPSSGSPCAECRGTGHC